MFLARKLRRGGTTAEVSILSPSNPDLIAMYTMDNISGTTLVNETGNTTFDGTFLGSAPNNTPVAGIIDTDAIEFSNLNDSTANFVRLGSVGISLTSDFTIVFWINSPDVGHIQFGSGFPDKTTTDFMRLDTIDVFVTSADAGATTYAFPTEVDPLGTWVLLGIERVGTTARVFRGDGDYSTTVDSSHTGEFLLKYLGKGSSDGSSGSNSKLDQFRVFNRGLTSSEITSIFNE